MAHRRRVEPVSLYAVLGVVAVVCPVCLWALTDDARSAEKKARAAPLLTLIVGGLIGYLTGRVPGRPQEKSARHADARRPSGLDPPAGFGEHPARP